MKKAPTQTVGGDSLAHYPGAGASAPAAPATNPRRRVIESVEVQALRAARPPWVRFTVQDVFFQIAIAPNLFVICLRTRGGPVAHLFRPDGGFRHQCAPLWDHLSYDSASCALVRYRNHPRALLPPLDATALATLRNELGIPLSPMDHPDVLASGAYKAYFHIPKPRRRLLH